MHCDAYLVASTSSPSFTGSYVAPMALINAIIVASAHLQPKRSLDMLAEPKLSTEPENAGIKSPRGAPDREATAAKK